MSTSRVSPAQYNLRAHPPKFGFYRHFKSGTTYLLYGASVQEATGEVLYHYFSILTHDRWSRLRSVFLASVPPVGAGTSTNLTPRFTWWRNATYDELATAAFGGPDDILRVFGTALG